MCVCVCNKDVVMCGMREKGEEVDLNWAGCRPPRWSRRQKVNSGKL